MAIQTDLQRYFTPEAVGQLLKDSMPVRTPIWTRVFANTRMHPLAHITKRTVYETTGNVPLIKRGSASIGVHDGEEATELFEPQEIAINTVIKAKDLIDLHSTGNSTSMEGWVAEKLSNMRDKVFNTIEALCCQAIRGSIDYATKIYEGDLGKFKVDFGALIQSSSYTGFVGKWAAATLDEIFKDLSYLRNAITLKTRYGRKIGILAGTNVYFTLMAKAVDTNTTSTIFMKIEEDKLNLNGIIIENMGNAGYTNLNTNVYTKAIGDDEIYLFAEDAPFTMNYLAIDDIDSVVGPRLVARSFFPKQIKQDDPSGYKLIVKSKPFPMPVSIGSLIVDCLN